MTRKEGRKQIHSLLEDLRVMNQDGIDLYYDHSSNSQQYTNSDEYMNMFENKFQFFFGEEESSLMVQNEDNCVYLQENSKAIWNLCTGLPDYVEDVEEYKKGVLIDGMEE